MPSILGGPLMSLSQDPVFNYSIGIRSLFRSSHSSKV